MASVAAHLVSLCALGLACARATPRCRRPWTELGGRGGVVQAGRYQATWQQHLDAVRTRLGQLFSREMKSRKYTKTVPGAPDGDYVIVSFETRFEKKQHAIETVTPMKDPDGTWRVSGYFIR